MTRKNISNAVGNISARHIEEAADNTVARRSHKPTWRKWGTMAACFCLCALLGVGAWQSGMFNGNRQSPINTQQNEPSGSQNTIGTGDDVLSPDWSAQLPAPNFNSATLSIGVTNEIYLMTEDFVSLPYEELLDYYGVTLSAEELFSNVLTRSEAEHGGYGIYRNSTRGTYYDKNCVTFGNENKTTKVEFSFSKVAHRPSFFLSTIDTELRFTEINGRKLVVFQYTDDMGNLCYYSEFLQNGIGWYVGANGINEEDFIRILMSVVSPISSETEEHIISGTVVAVDTYAGIFSIMSDEQGISYTVWLPDGVSADEYALADRAIVTYKGEPALIQNIWSQQITNIQNAK